MPLRLLQGHFLINSVDIVQRHHQILLGYVDVPEGVAVAVFVFQSHVKDRAVVVVQGDPLGGTAAQDFLAQYVFFPVLGVAGADVHVDDGVAGLVGDVDVVVGSAGAGGEDEHQGGECQALVEAHGVPLGGGEWAVV